MICAWQSYLSILPLWMRKDVDLYGCTQLQELRLRIGLPPEMILKDNSKSLIRTVSFEDLQFVINCASQYSPWTASTIAEGFITADGGHRIGICGHAIIEKGIMRGIREPASLCIRVARDFPGIAQHQSLMEGSVLIIGPPGSGKTTLLRDLIRQRSESRVGSISVVDERGELYPLCKNNSAFYAGRRTDILRFCSKRQGVMTILKTMGPSCIAVDEITSEDDCLALQQTARCGVDVIGTIHAASMEDIYSRGLYRSLLEHKIIQKVVIMNKDKSWTLEEVSI